MNKAVFLLIVTILMQAAHAQTNSIKLLAINEATKQGTIVDLSLTLIDGTGKIFIETNPLSQIDTQISLRIAKSIACKTSEKYCLNKDFFYSVISNSPIIAGPSAGAAMALLTIVTLENKKLDSDTIMTGTINSGGVIGAVGGVKEKIKAAADAGLKKVLIPKGEINSSDLVKYGKEQGIIVTEVSDIEEAYGLFTHEKINYPELKVDQKYNEIMNRLNNEICDRTDTLKNEIENYDVPKEFLKAKESGLNLSNEAERLTKINSYYPSASKCFGANVYLREVLLGSKNLSLDEVQKEKSEIEKDLMDLEIELNSTTLTNLGELEAAMIVKERIYDAKENLKDINSTKNIRDLSYALERTYSAFAWKEFMKFPGKNFDETKLQESCKLKTEEVQELYNYVSIYLPHLLENTKKELEDAKSYLKTEDYALCLFKASKSEAEINAALSTVYINEDNVNALLQKKILAAEKTIRKQIEKGTFPVLGYSYYEYATALNETDKYSALLYAEYGIELSNLDIYLPLKKPFPLKINEKALLTLIFGFAIGVLLVIIKKQYRRKKIVLRRKH